MVARSAGSAQAVGRFGNHEMSRRAAALCAGARRLRLLSVTGFPSASVLGWQSSRLPTDYMGMAEVSRRTRGARPCPRHDRTFSTGYGANVYAACQCRATKSPQRSLVCPTSTYARTRLIAWARLPDPVSAPYEVSVGRERRDDQVSKYSMMQQ